MSAVGALRLMARYHLWSNRQIINAIQNAQQIAGNEKLIDRDCGIFFGTLHDTVAHIAGVDDLWYLRLSGQSSAPYNELYNGETNKRWKDIFGGSWEATTAALEKNAQRWADAVHQQGSTTHVRLGDRLVDVESRVTFLDTSGNPTEREVGAALLHVFNHGTHHRGQIHAGLTMLGVKSAPALDLPLVEGPFSITIPKKQ